MPATSSSSVVRVRSSRPSAAGPLSRINSSAPQPSDTHDCAVNNLAATGPAMAGDGRLANSVGTAMKPMPVRQPHQRAAARVAARCRIIKRS